MTVGFFMPLPLAVMIPFMAGQSFAMGEAFGKGFQYGKRLISSMTNEQFNAMSAKDHFEETTADISAMIPAMKAQMNNFSTLQTDIIKTLIEQLKDAGITISEAVTDLAKDTFEEGPPGGTDLAQTSLDQLRNLVGLPPIYSKLVAPSGIAALIKFWQDANLISALKLAANPTLWIANEIMKIFNQAPSGSNVNTIFNWIQSNLPDTFIGPPAPDNIQPPPPVGEENTLILDDAGNVIGTNDTRIPTGTAGTTRAPDSIITQFNKFNQETISIDFLIAQERAGSQDLTKIKAWLSELNRVWQLMLALWQNYDLVGKVNDSNYRYGVPLVS